MSEVKRYEVSPIDYALAELAPDPRGRLELHADAQAARDADRATIEGLRAEVAALRAELIDVLRESVRQKASNFYGSKEGAFSLDSAGMGAKSLRRLAALNQVDIISDDGRRVVARWRVGA